MYSAAPQASQETTNWVANGEFQFQNVIKYVTLCFAEKQEAVTVRSTELTLLLVDCIYEHIKAFAHITIHLQKHNLSISKISVPAVVPNQTPIQLLSVYLSQGEKRTGFGTTVKNRIYCYCTYIISSANSGNFNF